MNTSFPFRLIAITDAMGILAFDLFAHHVPMPWLIEKLLARKILDTEANQLSARV